MKRFRGGLYLWPIDSCITQLKAQGPSRTCNESKEEEEAHRAGTGSGPPPGRPWCAAWGRGGEAEIVHFGGGVGGAEILHLWGGVGGAEIVQNYFVVNVSNTPHCS